MPVEINWGLANSGPNIGQSALSGYQTGLALAGQRRQAQQQARVQSALAGYGSDPDGSINALIQAGAVQQAAALGGLRDQQTARTNRLTVGKAIQSAGDDPNALKAAAGVAAGTGDLDTYTRVHGIVSQMTAEQQAIQARKSAAIADASAGLLALPAEARSTAYQSIYAPKLQAAGVDPQTITGAQQHLSDDNFLTAQAQANSHAADILKGISDDAKQAETVRHNKADEGVAGINARANVSRAGTAAFSAQTGRMSYEARKKGVGGFGTPGVAGGGAGTDDAPPD